MVSGGVSSRRCGIRTRLGWRREQITVKRCKDLKRGSLSLVDGILYQMLDLALVFREYSNFLQPGSRTDSLEVEDPQVICYITRDRSLTLPLITDKCFYTLACREPIRATTI